MRIPQSAAAALLLAAGLLATAIPARARGHSYLRFLAASLGSALGWGVGALALLALSPLARGGDWILLPCLFLGCAAVVGGVSLAEFRGGYGWPPRRALLAMVGGLLLSILLLGVASSGPGPGAALALGACLGLPAAANALARPVR